MLALILILLIPGCLSACNQADRYECASSLCSTFTWQVSTTNTTQTSSCISDPNSTCTPQLQVPSTSSCISCSNLTASQCSSICIDWHFNTNNNTCINCSSLYGPECIKCTSTACTMCSFSSDTYPSNNSLTCTATPCTITNCSSCYNVSGAQRCYRCKPNYAVNSTYDCVAAGCSIPNCRICNGSGSNSQCLSCRQGYTLSLFSQYCDPVCPSICLNCINPNFCLTCVNGYTPSNGICNPNCASNNLVSNCGSCTNLMACDSCISGFSIVLGGLYCSPSCSDVNCIICSNSSAGTCTVCNRGFGLVNGSCVSIICSVQYCQSCSDLVTCSGCQNLFALAGGICLPSCVANISNCVLCSSASTCQICQKGYRLVSNTCQAFNNIANCQFYSSSSTCAICISGYILSGNQCKQTCSVQNCDTCSSSTICNTCLSGYNLVNGTKCIPQCGFGEVNIGNTSNIFCQICGNDIPNCYTCSFISTQNRCEKCIPGYFIDGFKQCSLCSQAVVNCKICQSPSVCTSCMPGFNLLNNNCVSSGCSSSVLNCLQCASTNTACTTCSKGFTLVNGTCNRISCSASFVFDPALGTCTCPSSSYAGKGGLCVSCSPECRSCSVLGCTSCKQRYYLDGASCLPCSSNCLSCISSTICTKCDRYFFPLNGVCSQISSLRNAKGQSSSAAYLCPTGCRICATTVGGKIECIQSQIGYNIGYLKVIEACDPSCRSCFGTTSNDCTSCYQGMILNSGQCLTCTDSNAVTCSPLDLAYSTTCLPGFTSIFYLSSNGSLINGGVCRSCALNCKKCDQTGPGNCDDGYCFVGYQKLQGTTNCTACLNGCSSCSISNLNICPSCPDGQFGTTGACQLCSSTCLTCSSTSTTCLSCPPSSTLINNTCYALPSNCFSLSSTDANCSACFQGYILSNNTCVFDNTCNSTVPVNSSNNGSCSSCADGWSLQSGICIPCPNNITNCLTCNPNNQNNCLKCVDGFFLSGGITCTPCTTGCQACSSLSFCLNPSPGYYLVYDNNGVSTGRSLRCTSPCATCSQDPNNCLTCNTNFTLYGTQCHSSSNILLRLVLSGSGTNPIPIDTNNTADNLAAGMAQINRILNLICLNLPAANYPGITPSNCPSFVRIIRMNGGSLIVQSIISGGAFSSNADANTAILSSFSNSSLLDGVAINSASVSASGFSFIPTEQSSDINMLALIIGASLGLIIIILLIILLCCWLCSRKTDQKDNSAPSANRIHSSQNLIHRDVQNREDTDNIGYMQRNGGRDKQLNKQDRGSRQSQLTLEKRDSKENMLATENRLREENRDNNIRDSKNDLNGGVIFDIKQQSEKDNQVVIQKKQSIQSALIFDIKEQNSKAKVSDKNENLSKKKISDKEKPNENSLIFDNKQKDQQEEVVEKRQNTSKIKRRQIFKKQEKNQNSVIFDIKENTQKKSQESIVSKRKQRIFQKKQKVQNRWVNQKQNFGTKKNVNDDNGVIFHVKDQSERGAAPVKKESFDDPLIFDIKEPSERKPIPEKKERTSTEVIFHVRDDEKGFPEKRENKDKEKVFDKQLKKTDSAVIFDIRADQSQ